MLSLIHGVGGRVAFFGFPPLVFVLVPPPQIEMGIVAGFVALCHDGFLEPRNGVVPLLLLDQISPDIVVRVSEIGIYLYGLQTFGDGAVVVAKERISPAAEGVGLGHGESIDG